MKKLFSAITTVNTFGAIGYMLLIAAWAFFAAVGVALLVDPSIRSLPSEVVQQSTVHTPTEPSPAVIVASYALTGLVIVVSVFIIITLPYFIGKWGSRMVRCLMGVLKMSITRDRLFLVKSVLATLPLVGLMIIHFTLHPESITFGAMYVATVGVSVLSIGSFLLQQLVARRLKTPAGHIW